MKKQLRPLQRELMLVQDRRAASALEAVLISHIQDVYEDLRSFAKATGLEKTWRPSQGN